MADVSDVEQTLVNLIVQAVYPNSTSSPSVANCDVRVYRGSPLPNNLDADLAAGKVNVNVVAMPGMERNTTRFGMEFLTSSIATASLTLTVTNNTVTIGGTNTTIPTTVMVINNGTGFAYSVQPGDTLNTIATNVAGLIPGASAAGSVITIAGSHNLSAKLSVSSTSIQEVKRQERAFKVMIHAPSDTIRNQISSAIDVFFAINYRITLPDNFYARLKYQSTHEIDSYQKQNNFRRDLIYLVDYATVNVETDYTIADPFVNSFTVNNPPF